MTVLAHLPAGRLISIGRTCVCMCVGRWVGEWAGGCWGVVVGGISRGLRPGQRVYVFLGRSVGDNMKKVYIPP